MKKQFELLTKEELDASYCKDSFYLFVKEAWSIVLPNEAFVDGWHIEFICNALEKVYSGDVRRLIINIPPRHMKSMLLNVFFPAWVWTKEPQSKFVCASFAESLTSRDSLHCRNLILSDWYQTRFAVKLARGQIEKVNFENTAKGFRKSYGFGGGMTGEGGDYLLIDDPIKIQDADSVSVRNDANFVMDNVVPSRLNNPKTGRIVLIMQRLNEDDPTGHVVDKNSGWEQIILPVEYEGNRMLNSQFKDQRTVVGELLWEKRMGEKEIKSLKADLSEQMYAAQYQQRPSPILGNIFKRDWFANRYENLPISGIFISADTAASVGTDSARSAIVVGGLTEDYRLLPIDVIIGKWEYPQLVEELVKVCTKYKNNLYELIIENKSSGISAVQTLRQTAPDWLQDKIKAWNPSSKMSKSERAGVYSKWCEKGCVILPPPQSGTSWLLEFEEEIFNFPNGKYKDQTDSFVMLIAYLENYLAEGLHGRIGERQ